MEMDGMSVVSVIVTLVGQVTHVIVTLVRHRRKLVERVETAINMISVEMSGNVYVANVNVPQITQENIVNVITKDVVMKMVYCVQEMVYVIVLYVCVTKVTMVPDVNVPHLQICVVMIMVLCVQVMVSVSVASVNVLLIIGERSVNNVQHVQESVKPIKIVLNVWGSKKGNMQRLNVQKNVCM